jgi:hypothetical protein
MAPHSLNGAYDHFGAAAGYEIESGGSLGSKT